MTDFYAKTFCTNCNEKNMVPLGNLEDDTTVHVEAVECFRCMTKYWLDESCLENYVQYLPDYYDDDGDYETKPNGESGPWTPDEILETMAVVKRGKQWA